MRMNPFSVCACSIAAATTSLAGPLPPRDATSPLESSKVSAFDAAVDRVAAKSADPTAAKRSLLLRVGGTPACYPDSLTSDEWEAIFQSCGLLPPADGPGEGVQVRYYAEPQAWVGQGLVDTANRAQPAFLTYSFPDDGITWGVAASGYPTGPNVLNEKLVSLFGDLDLGREHIRQAMASWRLHAGVRYTEVADDNAAMSQIVGRTSLRGDIRIGATNLGSGVLAYNAYPLGSGSTTISGGDMCLNSFYFLTAFFNNASNDYRYLRNTVTHEHGHGLGLRHSVPCDITKIMEPQVGGTINGIQIDDIRGGQRNYGDRFSGNSSGATATQLGELSSPVPRSVLLTSVSTNGNNGYNNSSQDWYTFTLSSPRQIVISAEPYGGVYTTSPQSSGCTGPSETEANATATGLLRIELRKPANTLLQSVNAPSLGSAAMLNAGTLSAGTYYVQVRDVNNNPIANNQYVQLYDLKVSVDNQPFPPLAFAGISKRIAAHTDCWLIGHLHSRALHPGASVASYDWDLDGDGVFETHGSPASYQYVSNGTHQAALRVTDSNDQSSTDTINVAVHGATTTVTSISPPAAGVNTTIPVIITGTNFKGVTSASQIVVSGAGVSVSGTPQVNHLGTQISGISFFVSPTAPLGARNITVNNSDGMGASATGVGIFTVGNVLGACCNGTTCTVTLQAACTGGAVWQGAGTTCGTAGNPTTCCRANFDGLGGVAVPDIFAFLSAWFAGSPSANIDGVGGIAVPDIFAFLSLWFAGCP